MKRLFSHADLRVRDRGKAKVFYDALFAPLGMAAEEGEDFVTYTIEPDAPLANQEWFGFTEDRNMTAGTARLSFYADTRELVDAVAAAARAAGARAIEGPALELGYGPTYYAVFFEDPDGNNLEVCCLA